METMLIGKLGTAATKAVLRLSEMKVGDTISPEEMGDLIGLNCETNGPGRPAIRKAIDRLRAKDRVNISWDMKNKVWKRTNDSETTLQTFSDVKRARRATKRGLQRVQCVTQDNLNDDEKAEFRASATQLALANIGLSSETRKQIPKGETAIDSQRLLLSIRSLGK